MKSTKQNLLILHLLFLLFSYSAIGQDQISDLIYDKVESFQTKVVQVDSNYTLIQNKSGLYFFRDSIELKKLFVSDSIHLKSIHIINKDFGVFIDSLGSYYFCNFSIDMRLDLMHFIRFDDIINLPRLNGYNGKSFIFLVPEGFIFSTMNQIYKVTKSGIEEIKYEGINDNSYSQYLLATDGIQICYKVNDKYYLNNQRVNWPKSFNSSDLNQLFFFQSKLYAQIHYDSLLFEVSSISDSINIFEIKFPERLHGYKIEKDTLFLNTSRLHKKYFLTNREVAEYDNSKTNLQNISQFNGLVNTYIGRQYSSDFFTITNSSDSTLKSYSYLYTDTEYPFYSGGTVFSSGELLENDSLSFVPLRVNDNEMLFHTKRAPDTLLTSWFQIHAKLSKEYYLVERNPNRYISGEFYEFNTKTLMLKEIDIGELPKITLYPNFQYISTGEKNISVGRSVEDQVFIGKKDLKNNKATFDSKVYNSTYSGDRYFLEDSVYAINKLSDDVGGVNFISLIENQVVYLGRNSKLGASFYTPKLGNFNVETDTLDFNNIIYQSQSSIYFTRYNTLYFYNGELIRKVKHFHNFQSIPDFHYVENQNILLFIGYDINQNLELFFIDPINGIAVNKIIDQRKVRSFKAINNQIFIDTSNGALIVEIVNSSFKEKDAFWEGSLASLSVDNNSHYLATAYEEQGLQTKIILFQEKEPNKHVLLPNNEDIYASRLLYSLDSKVYFLAHSGFSMSVLGLNLNTLKTQKIEIKRLISENPLIFETKQDGIYARIDEMGLNLINSEPINSNIYKVDENNLYVFGQIYGNDPQIYLMGAENVINADSLWADAETLEVLEVEVPLFSEKTPEFDISIFPNPFSQYLNLDLDKISGDIDIKLFNQIGQKVFHKKFQLEPDPSKSHHIIGDLKYLPSGAYYVLLSSEGKWRVLKKIIKH